MKFEITVHRIDTDAPAPGCTLDDPSPGLFGTYYSFTRAKAAVRGQRSRVAKLDDGRFRVVEYWLWMIHGNGDRSSMDCSDFDSNLLLTQATADDRPERKTTESRGI